MAVVGEAVPPYLVSIILKEEGIVYPQRNSLAVESSLFYLPPRNVQHLAQFF